MLSVRHKVLILNFLLSQAMVKDKHGVKLEFVFYNTELHVLDT